MGTPPHVFPADTGSTISMATCILYINPMSDTNPSAIIHTG
ncbi:hypothetical protein HMPREF1861_01112 [Corynebacterium kroppenstedtii]|nr:hypothetical protein HMPREF1861_01112 [Corynebacterium kroppenstedtii]